MLWNEPLFDKTYYDGGSIWNEQFETGWIIRCRMSISDMQMCWSMMRGGLIMFVRFTLWCRLNVSFVISPDRHLLVMGIVNISPNISESKSNNSSTTWPQHQLTHEQTYALLSHTYSQLISISQAMRSIDGLLFICAIVWVAKINANDMMVEYL